MTDILRTANLTKQFGGLVAVNGIDYELRSSISAIIGPNGAGKTTFFDLIVAKLTPTKGKVFFHGEDITQLKPFERAKRGVVKTFQIGKIFPNLSVFDNVLLAATAPSDETRERGEARRVTESLLSESGLLQRGDEVAGELEYGHQRVLEVAMAMAARPKLLLLDEPFAGLALGEMRRMEDMILRCSKRCPIMLIEHKMDVVLRLAERISVMHRGGIIAEGSPEEIRSNNDVIDAYLGRA